MLLAGGGSPQAPLDYLYDKLINHRIRLAKPLLTLPQAGRLEKEYSLERHHG
jgi:hypothetical protein